MKRWLSLLGALAVAVGVVVGANALAGGQGSPAPPPPKPAFDFTPEPPLPGSILAQRPEFSRQPPVQVTVKGKTIVLPAPANLRVGTYPQSPCGQLTGLPPVEIATLGFGTSVVRFTRDGLLIEPHIDPLDQNVLAPLLEQLTPGELPQPQCVTIKGQITALPPGATWSGVHAEFGPDVASGAWPQDYYSVQLGASRVLFTSDGILLDATIHPEDERPLRPLLDMLTPR